MAKDLSLYQLNEQKLDATKQAADALRIDAATINNGLTVQTSVPADAKFTDTVYTHPATHPPTIIAQDANNRFVTDAQKNSWNAKAETTLATPEYNGLMSSVDKAKLNGIEPQANKYTHPVSHPATMITEDATHRFLTDAERTKLNGIEPQANKYIHPSTHPASIITQDESNRFVTDTQIARWNNTSTADHVHTKAQIGLGNVDNTSDINKPISTATQEALNTKLEKTGGTITGKLTILGTAAQEALLTRGIQGSDGSGQKGDLYLNYNNTNKVYVNGTNRVLDTRDIATTSVAGIVQLTSVLTDASETKAATAKAVKTLQDTKANISGNISADFNVKSLNVSGPILPTTTSLIDIGSPTNRFRAIYVDDVHLSTNTLYLGDTPVMGTSQDTVIIKADPDQSIMLKTSAAGTTKISSESGTELSTSGMNADVVLKAAGSGAKVNVSADQQVNFTAPDINFNGGSTFKNDATIKKNLVVEGDLVVKGQNHIIEAETVTIKDNIIEINKGQVGNGVTAGQAGLKVNRGDSPAYYMIFDEVDDMFKVGMESSLQTIASRDWVNSVMYTHPSTHPATMITEDATHRFLTDTERNKLNGIETNANKYVHPSNHPASMITEDSLKRFVTDGQKQQWNDNTKYTNSTPTLSALGGIPAGTTFDNLPVKDLLTNLLYPYMPPTISLNATVAAGVKELGISIPNITFTMTTGKKSQNITDVELFRSGTKVTTIASPKPNGGTETYIYQTSTNGTCNFQAKVSDGKQTVSSNTISYTFVHPLYIGSLDGGISVPNQAQIKGMTKQIVIKGTQNFTYTIDTKRMAIACPPGWTIKQIIDPNNFDITATFKMQTLAITCADGTNQNYTVYISEPTTVSNFAVKFVNV